MSYTFEYINYFCSPTNLILLEKEDCSNNQCAGPYAKLKNWRVFVSTALAAAVVASCSSNISALADLNKYEAETRGEFGIGSAAQFGSADLRSVSSMRIVNIVLLMDQ